MFEIYDVVIIPLILGIVELFKMAGVSKKVSPFPHRFDNWNCSRGGLCNRFRYQTGDISRRDARIISFGIVFKCQTQLRKVTSKRCRKDK